MMSEDGKHIYYNRWTDEAGVDHENRSKGEVGYWFAGKVCISFNGKNYDDHILAYFLNGATNSQLKDLSDDIINGNRPTYTYAEKYGYGTSISSAWAVRDNNLSFIDIMNVLPLKASLKLYGARIHSELLQELPIHFDKYVTGDEVLILREYCRNDCTVTWDLFHKIEPQIDLRVSMGDIFRAANGAPLDLRSLSDAQIAERIYKEEYMRKNHVAIPWERDRIPGNRHIKYKPYDKLKFGSKVLRDFLNEIIETDFMIRDSGYIETPETLLAPNPRELKTRKPRGIEIAGKTFNVGLGGLHSADKPGSWYANDEFELIDIDVTAYYPNIILNSGIYPVVYGEMFLDVYRRLVEMRVKAKHDGDKVMDAALKVTINGTFGKLGSSFSTLYTPELLLFITLTGQLSLLMLIEAFAAAGIQVISANTDGITVRSRNADKYILDEIVSDWEKQTEFNMEFTEYRSVHMRDVNNYIAIKTDGSVKRKGAYASASISTNPASQICVEAVVQYVLNGIPVDWTVEECTDIGQFITVRTCLAGASWNGGHVGKALRWYYSNSDDRAPLLSNKNGNKVAKSDNCRPLMNLSKTLPFDLDYDYYIKEANKMLQQLKVFL